MGEAEGQERRELYRRVRKDPGRRSAAARRRRRDLRPYPLRHHPRRAWHPLHELRRLGGKLHRARRARGRPVRNHHLGRSAAKGSPRSPRRGARRMTKILVATDAWHPQVNGVVRTLTAMAEAARGFGVEVSFLTPQSFRTIAMPSYPGLRLALPYPAKIARLIAAAKPDSIHIATEGPIGLLVRRYCRKRGLPFTTSFHTRFPEYVSARSPVPESWVWRALRAFHRPSQAVMAATPALAAGLRMHGFRNVVLWSRGVDTSLFHPRSADLCLPMPVFLSVGRLAVEKNLEAFLDLDLPGTKLVVGDGPALTALQRKYPDAVFLGARHGEELAEIYAASDIFVFPSKTDTLGLVLLEALAGGLPVAAFPVTGPRDVIGPAPVGVLDEDLRAACLAALEISPQACVDFAAQHTWEASTRAFVENMADIHAASPEAAGAESEPVEFVAEQPRFVA